MKTFYVSKLVTEGDGARVEHFATTDETEARELAAGDPAASFLLVYERGVVVERPERVPVIVLRSAHAHHHGLRPRLKSGGL